MTRRLRPLAALHEVLEVRFCEAGSHSTIHVWLRVTPGCSRRGSVAPALRLSLQDGPLQEEQRDQTGHIRHCVAIAPAVCNTLTIRQEHWGWVWVWQLRVRRSRMYGAATAQFLAALPPRAPSQHVLTFFSYGLACCGCGCGYSKKGSFSANFSLQSEMTMGRSRDHD